MEDFRNEDVKRTEMVRHVDIYGYNLRTKTEIPICVSEDGHVNPLISDEIIIWHVYDKTDFDNPYRGMHGVIRQ